MAQNVQIQCINKTNRNDPHDRIQFVGGVSGGQRWKMSQKDAISYIENGTYAFYVSVNGQSVWVIVATNNGNKYIKTQNDGQHPNNLLSLPECP
jgi:predicted secreted protein